jgi:Lysylphosphatidylglycerol synthase TM region
VSTPHENGAAPADARARRRYRWLWACGLAVYLLALWYFGWHNVRDALAALDTRFLAAALCVETASIGLRVVKWRYVLGKGQNAPALFFVSKTAGSLTPMRLGELSPLLLKRHRNPRVGAWIVLDRLLEMSATLVLGAMGVVALGRVLENWIPVIVGAACVLVMVPTYLVTRRSWFLWVYRHFPVGSITARGAEFLAGVSEEIAGLRRYIPVTASVTVLVTSLDLVSGILMYRGLSFILPFSVAATAQCTHAVTAAIPFTPNPTGVPFVAACAIIHEFGHIPSEVIVAAVPILFAVKLTVFWTLAGVCAWWARKGGP